MSYKALYWAWSRPLQGPQKPVLSALAGFANSRTSECRPSIAAIAEKAGVSERTAQRAVRELEQLGLVRVMSGGGRHLVNTYQLPVDKSGEKVSHSRVKGVTVTPESGFESEVLRGRPVENGRGQLPKQPLAGSKARRAKSGKGRSR